MAGFDVPGPGLIIRASQCDWNHPMSSDSDAVKALGETKLFGGLDAEQLKVICGRMRPASFARGQQIFSRGDPGKELYFVRKGRVRLSMISSDGRELSLTHAVEGDIFGEIATIDGGPRTADATAVNAVSTLVLSGAALHETMERHPRIAMAMMRFLCSHIRNTDERLESIAMHPIEVRLARFLLSAVRLKWPDTDAEKVTLDLDMPQHELAMLIGASRPKVNAAIALLEDTGAIERNGTRIVCNLELLNDYVEPA